ncbi:DNA-binding response regulator [Bacillus siamensis]|uniref:response regulator transcription factor n=1 Tax=Bacillus TaxID=1386 RepID=UPI0002FD83F7|nr:MULTISPECIES: response regulator transcription factor [Bacillus]MBD0407571.1 response regulator transcription factor [Bacillus sp. 1021]MDU0814439.1 response regulator transcription factor [Bacillus siamensis]MEC3655302.1 response regulator transcription factor [Bacillus siamensis]MED0771181.1 response regulator transcription factor [Bacillus siamensis]MED0774328.1 response regulator transcription factor [Bacillus siamensis]
MIRVLLIDDHEMVRMGLAAFLEAQPDIEVAGEASDGQQGVDLAAALLPDVILMDLVMDGMDGIEATRQICAKLDDPKIIVLTSFIDDDKVYPVIEAGALSYLLKTSKAAEIAEAIRAAAKGEPKLESKVAGKVLSRLRHSENQLPHETLTKRELEILCLVAEGKTNKEIGEELFITIKTVKTHITNILSKLDVSDRTQAAVYAHRNHLVK